LIEAQMSAAVKQVIVMRTHYPDGNGGFKKIRTGKMIAQGAHASMGALLSARVSWLYARPRQFVIQTNPEIEEWLAGKFTKIVVGVKTEAELFDLHKKAQEAGLLCALIQDAGDTEFAGVPTYTALGIGPAESSKIDQITGQLSLI